MTGDTACGPTGEEELYDHRTDTQEWRNLAADPDHATIKDELRDELWRLTGRGE